MSDRPNRNGTNRQFDGANPPKVPPMKIDMSQLSTLHCPNDLNSGFVLTYQLMEVPTLLQGPGVPPLIRREMMMCPACGGMWDQSQLKRLTPQEREIARAQMALKMEMARKEAEV